MLDFISFSILPDGTVQCDFREGGQSLTSFDTFQLPAKLTDVLGEIHTPLVEQLAKAQADLATERARAADLETQLGEAQGQVTVLESRVVRLQDQLAKEDV